jgi:hypothetical protein
MGWDKDEMASNWFKLVQAIISSSSWDVYKILEKPSEFWSAVLQDKTIARTRVSEFLIRFVMSIPSGSVIAERGFSIFGIILRPDRASMSAQHLDALMRIRINGPATVNEFNALRYAKLWVAQGHHHADSDFIPPNRQRETGEERSDSDESENDSDTEDVEPGTIRKAGNFQSSIFR